MSGDELYEELRKQAFKMALARLKEKGADGLTTGEVMTLELGIACGAEVLLNKLARSNTDVGAALRKPADHFAE